MSEAPIIVIRDVTGEVTRVALEGERAIVGRAQDAQVRLDHGMVSRHHAEFAREANGRLRVRDLGSRNGTLVDGQPVNERLLQGSEQIGVGPFLLSILWPGRQLPDGPPSTSTRIILSEGGGKISTLKDLAAPRVDAALLTTLSEFSQQLLDTADSAARGDALCKLMVGPQFRGRWAVVVRLPQLEPGAADRPPQLLHEAYGAMANREPYLSRSVLRIVRETGEAALAANVGLPTEVEINVEVSISPHVMAMAAVACPVATHDGTMDILYVMLPPSYGSGEWLALVNLAVRQYQQAESAWSARKHAEAMAAMERELARAKQIQTRLVPMEPRFPGLDLAIGFSPCRWIGGDYVDAVAMPDGRALLAIADVCGKGLPAALIASSLHTMVHAGVLGGLRLPELMTNLNRYLCRTLPDESFVTMLIVGIDTSTGAMEIVNAGHPPPMLYGEGYPEPLENGVNLPLGIEPNAVEPQHAELLIGQWLTLYTDGLTELSPAGDDMLGVAGLARELHTLLSPDLSAQSAATFLSNRLDVLQGQAAPNDDRTFLLLKRVPA